MACTYVEMDGCDYGYMKTSTGCVPCGGTAPNGIPIKQENGAGISGQDVLNAAPNIISSIGGFIRNVTGKGGPQTVVYGNAPATAPAKKPASNNTPLLIGGAIMLVGGIVIFMLRKG